MTRNDAIGSLTSAYLGISEWPGSTSHNPEILKMFDDSGHPNVNSDETPWCAAFVGSILAQLGLPTSGKLNARSYLTYGAAVEVSQALPWDIVVLWRGSPEAATGHVGFLVRFEGDKVVIRGGNQGNKVSDAAFPLSRVLKIRRADGVAASNGKPTLRVGDSGVHVRALQMRLSNLGYTLGKLDSNFGSRTLAAVVAFQNDLGLLPDGIVGDRTWEALSRPLKPRGTRDIDEKDLAEHSRTIQASQSGGALVGISTALGAGSAAVSAGEEALAVLDRTKGLTEALWASGPWVVLALVLGLLGFLAFRRFQRVKALRIEDARSGANDRI